MMFRRTSGVKVSEADEPMAKGTFEPEWESLRKYKTPEWFRNAKFGIWAHWGPQCVEGSGDWMARGMYQEGSHAYKHHVANYGHPSEVGFKDILPLFKAEQWNPDSLVAIYKSIGAQYFFVLGNHHDNFDLWDSKYQPWNVGSGQDPVIRDSHLVPIAVITSGRLIPCPGMVCVQADPERKTMLAGCRSPFGENVSFRTDIYRIPRLVFAVPEVEVVMITLDVINRYNPDLLYFDTTGVPFYPVSDAGLKIAAHFYNHNMQTHGGKNEAVMFGKILTDLQKEALVWDVERGAPNEIIPLPWQSCSCIGGWHYNTDIYNKGHYKSAQTVIRLLADIVSKNGNLLLNIPLRADGTFGCRSWCRILQTGVPRRFPIPIVFRPCRLPSCLR